MTKSINFLISIIFLFSSFSSKSQSQEENIDARWIINKTIQNMGGESYLRSIKTLYTEMSTVMEGRSVKWITKEMVPNNDAFQIIYNDRIVYEDYFNGKNGFEINGGQKVETDSKELADKFARKNIFNELDYLDTTIYKIARLEDEKVDNAECYKVKATFITGSERILYFDKKTFDVLREDKRESQNDAKASSMFFSGYKKYGNLRFYRKIIMGSSADAQVATITKLVVNDIITEADFNK